MIKYYSMDESKETGRLEAFSDGVFAVAITLLILNIKIPGLGLSPNSLPDDSALWSDLLREWPMLVAYTTSFATVGIMWLNHNRLFATIKRIDTVLILLNLLLLLIIVFIPVPTALLATYIGSAGERTAALLYSATSIVLSCCFNLLWRYASYHNRLLGDKVDSKAVVGISVQYLFGLVLYLVTLGLAWISPPGSVVLIFIIALFFALPGRSLLEKNVSDVQGREGGKRKGQK